MQFKSVIEMQTTVRIIQRTPLHTWLTQASSGLQVLLYVAILCLLGYNYCACGEHGLMNKMFFFISYLHPMA